MNGGKEKFDGFLLSVEQNKNKSTKVTYERTLKYYVGMYGYDFLDDYDLLENMIIQSKPRTINSVSNTMSVIRKYAEYLGHTQALRYMRMLDRNEIWEQVKPTINAKFISFKTYDQISYDIEMNEEYNNLFYVTLWQSIWEGIYNEDMSVLDNLRSSDVHKDNLGGCFVELRNNDGEEWSINITNELYDNLKALSLENKWYRKNKSGVCEIDIAGKYKDSVFKFENRGKGGAENGFRYSYYLKLRKITSEYIGYTISAKDIFISGMMYRISNRLNKKGLSTKKLFEHTIDKEVCTEISNEIENSHFDVLLQKFKEMIKTYPEVFIENDSLEN